MYNITSHPNPSSVMLYNRHRWVIVSDMRSITHYMGMGTIYAQHYSCISIWYIHQCCIRTSNGSMSIRRTVFPCRSPFHFSLYPLISSHVHDHITAKSIICYVVQQALLFEDIVQRALLCVQICQLSSSRLYNLKSVADSHLPSLLLAQAFHMSENSDQ